MFKRSFRSQDQTQSRVEKATRLKRSGSIRDPTKLSKLQRSLTEQDSTNPKPPKKSAAAAAATSATATAPSPSPIVTLTVGRDGRLFAAHEDVLRQSPFFEAALRSGYRDAQSRRISLPDEEPEALSALLE